MLCLSLFSPGVLLFLYDSASVHLSPGCSLPPSTFFAILNSISLFGGLAGRWTSYSLQPRHPLLYALLSITGAGLNATYTPLLALPRTFLILLGDGLNYGTISRHIDAKVPRHFNLIAISYWLFIGDMGSVLGSNIISYARDWISHR